MGRTPTVLAAILALAFCFLSTPLRAETNAVSLADLQGQKDLTPERFIRFFSGFKFELSDRMQDPATFIQRKSGDCDDFAGLAAKLLTQRGYHTKIVVVMMGEQTHVVCYVKEAAAFLDFNHRSDAQPMITTDGSLEDIATKVATDFRTKWRLASEVRFEGSKAVFVDNVFPLAAPAIQAKNDKSESSGSVEHTESASSESDSTTSTTGKPAVSLPVVN